MKALPQVSAPLPAVQGRAWRSRLASAALLAAAFFAFCPSAQADLAATFDAASDVPLTASSYTASGNLTFTLHFAPEPGTNLTVVKNTGLPFIQGAFNNLANGATVNLSFNGTTYPFIAWYYGGDGNNDLVLLWPYMRMAAWGGGSWGQLGNGNYGNSYAAIVVLQRRALAGKTIVQVVASGGTSFALTSEGKVFSWGSGANGMLGTNQAFYNVEEPAAVNVSAGTSALFGKTVVNLAGGATHCLALCSDGTLVSWGNNANGQLGDNTTTQRLVPVLVNTAGGVSALSGKTVVAIAAGESHSLALCSDGTLAAWGLNDSGQLGNNQTVGSLVPTLVSALFGKSVAVIDAGTNHNLALCMDGTLVSWGSNANGELGDNSTTQREIPVLVNTNAGSALYGKSVVNISAGGATSLALCSDGTLAAWGSNSHGQLGNGSTTPRQAPFRVSADSGSALQGKSVVSITAGGTSSLALCSDGTLTSWGNNTEGQLGDTSSLQRLLPVAVNASHGVSVLAGKKVRQIGEVSVYQNHSIILFGMVLEHMLVSGNGLEISNQDTIPSVGDHTDFGHANLHGATVTRTFMVANDGLLDITFSGSPVIAVTGAHAGDFSVFNLHLYSSSSLSSPYWSSFEVRFDPKDVGTRSATVSIQNSTQDTNPFIFAIQGSSADPEIVLEQPAGTELSKGGTRDFGENIPGHASDLPFVIRNIGGVGSLLSGLTITLSGTNASEFSIIGTPASALVGSDGSTSFVVRFNPQTGGTKTAMLSIANNDTDENPYQIEITGSAPTSLSTIFNSGSDVGMTVNGLKASAIPLNITLNFAPEPGMNLTVVRNTGLAHINGTFANMANGATVNLSYNGTSYPFVAWYYGGEGNNDLVLLWPRTGLATWGDNSRGQLGDGTTTGRQVPGGVDQSGALLGKTIVQVARGHNFVLALTSEGQIFSWGEHSSGQLGTGGVTSFRGLPGAISGGSLNNKKVVSIAAGHSHGLALCSDGTLVGWGANSQGQIGTGAVTAYHSSPTQVSRSALYSALTGKTVVSIAAGGEHSLALCSDGTLAAWGDNQKGQLGNNNTDQQSYPNAVNQASGVSALFGKTVTAISAGADHSLALCSDGTAVSWGGNGFGQLGLGTTTDSMVPVQVSTTDGVSALSGRSVVSMMACGSHSRALCSDGIMAAWGSNNAGTLGDATTTDRWVPVAVNPSGGGGVLQGRSIVAFTSSQALCSDGTLAAWGSNSNGQVGDNTTMDRPTPVAVNTDSGLSALAGYKVSGLGGLGLPTSPSAAIYGRTLVSKIGLSGNATVIAHGDITPSVTDHTDFVGANVAGGSVVRTFTVRNWEILPLNLTGSPKVQISGPHASEFTVTTQPASPVASLQGSSTFQITFNPAALGERSALVSIASDDESLPVFSFTVLGRGVEPELVVEQPGGAGLVENEMRDFRQVPVGAGQNMIFTVKNTAVAGSQLLDFAITFDGANASDFSLADGPDAPVAGPDGLTTFTVRFTPLTLGQKSAVLHLASNDSDESPFDIQLTGEGFDELEAVFNEGSSAAHVVSDFIANGTTLNMTLNFAPTPGTNLTVIKNTGPSFIEGAFTNLPNGATVNLSYNGTTYPFVAWYYGGEGNNDLVLLWPKTMLSGWGNNSSRQLAGSISFMQPAPKLVDAYGILEGKTFVQVAQGREHCMALTTEGRVYAWGTGQLGDNSQSFVSQPVAVNTSTSLFGKTVVAVAAGAYHSLALCSDGTVSAWGNGFYGQLGIGWSGSSLVPTYVSGVSALAGKFVTAIAAGEYSSLALCSDGTVVAWGSNSSGQLGDNTQTERYAPVAVNAAPALSALYGRTVVAISAGASYSLALCSDGTVTSWGDNTSGQLGDNTTTQRLVPVAVNAVEGTSALFGKTVTSLAAGGSHSMVLCSDGAVSAWGDNSAGQLGDGSLTNRLNPVLVSVAEGVSALFGKTVTGISTGAAHSLALCSDGTVASWGRNAYGQLGDNTQTSRSAPVPVNTAAGVSVLAGLHVTRLAGPAGLSESSVAIFPARPCDIYVAAILSGGSSVEIVDGDTTPTLTDRTDFGGVLMNGTISQPFRVANAGLERLEMTGSPLIMISGPHALDFAVIATPSPSTLIGGQSTTFTLRFSPRAIGVRTAIVTIISNDPDEAPYNFSIQGTGTAAEIEVRESDVNVADGGTVGFGSIGLVEGLVVKTFTINNLGNVELTGLAITKDGSHPNQFTVITQPAASVPPNGSTTFTVQSSTATMGLKTAVLHIASNDSNESPFDITLTATGVPALLPVATTSAATGITFDGATLNGKVNANDAVWSVIFDYGTTTSYGSSIAATPGTLTGNTLTNVAVTLTNLLPHTKYHFRVRAVGNLGSANGTSMSFTTLNRASGDTVLALPLAKVTIPVLTNDGAGLSIVSFTQPGTTVGTVVKVGVGLVFTPSATFTGGSFTYTASDALGLKSNVATVTLQVAACTLGADVTIPADSPPYDLTVSATAPWTVIESLSWLSFVPPAPGATSVRFIPAPNPSKDPRTGTVKIGGKTHTVTQSGVLVAPVLTTPAPIPNAAISANYDLIIPTLNGPVTYTITGMPKGLTLSNVTGHITGYPTEAKTSSVTVKAKNVWSDSNTISFDITVLPFPPSLVGSYSAAIADSETLTDKLGGLMTMSVTNTGGVTGTLKLGAGSHSFTGRLNTAVNPLAPDPDHAVLKTSVKRTGKSAVDLTVNMNSTDTDLITGDVTLPGAVPAIAALSGSKHVWHATTKPADLFKGYFTAALEPTDPSASIPQGDGFLTFSVSAAGAVSWSGQLADGTVITTQSSTLWANGEFPLFALLYGGKGSLSQKLYITPDIRAVVGSPHWHKKPQTTRAYAAGFGPTALNATGAEYLPPGIGQSLLNIAAPGSANIDFSGGGMDSVSQFSDLDQVFNVSATHAATFTGVNPALVKLTKLDVIKGTFIGSLTLKDTNPFNAALPQVVRPVTFNGVLLPASGKGTGYFLLPGITGPPANVTTSPMTSGRVRILP